MKRHQALQDLSRDHHEALVQAQRLQKGALAGEEADALSPKTLADDFLSFWNDHAADHFREEEEVLLPIYSRYEKPTSCESIRTMLNDHAWFRNAVIKLQELLERSPDESELNSYLQTIGERLQKHAKMEEQELFEILQDTLSEEDLSEIEQRSNQFRNQGRTVSGKTNNT